MIEKYPWNNATQALPSIQKRKPWNPIVNIRWLDCIYFANALSRDVGLEEAYVIEEQNKMIDVHWKQESTGFRLPTEAEWWHCTTGGFLLDEIDQIKTSIGYFDNKTHPIGQKSPNIYGVCDFYGHIREWVWDRTCHTYAYCLDNFEKIKRDYKEMLCSSLLDEGYHPLEIPKIIDSRIKKFDINIFDQDKLDQRLFLKDPTGSKNKTRKRIIIGWKTSPPNNDDQTIFGFRMPEKPHKRGKFTGFRLLRTLQKHK